MKKRFLATSLSALVLLLSLGVSSTASAAGAPSVVSYQGRLADASGNLLGGSNGTTYFFKFSLWTSPTVGQGSRVWPVSVPGAYSTTVKQGVFTANIGDTGNGYPDALTYDFSNPNVYLQVEVSSDGSTYETLSPRQQLTSAVFAHVATMANAVVSASSTIDTLTSQDITTARATTTALAVSGLTSSLLKTNSIGQLVSATTGDFFSTTSANFLLSQTSSLPNLTTLLGLTDVTAMRSTTTEATTTSLYVSNALFGAGLSDCNSVTGKLVWSNGQFICATDSGSSGNGITAFGAQYSTAQTGATQTLATSSDTNIGLVITSSGDTHTFTPTWIGTLGVARGGTGLGSVTNNQLLIGGPGNTVAQVSTSSLGLLTTNVAEGSNLYYTDNRVLTYLDTLNKGYFFSTTSADYWDSTKSRWATTTTDYWLSQRTTDDLTQGATNKYYASSLFATDFASKSTTDLAEGSNQYFTPARADARINATTTLGTLQNLPNLVNTTTTNATTTSLFATTGNFTNLSAANAISGSVTGNAGTVTNGVYTTTFNGLFDTRFDTNLAATSTLNNLSTLKGLTDVIATRSTTTNATTTNLSVSGMFTGAGLTNCDSTTGKLVWNNGQFSCGTDAGSTGTGITSIGAQYSTAQGGATQTFATSSDTNLGLVITSSSNTHTFTPTWIGTLAAGRGGTGISNPSAAGILLGSYAGGAWQQLATSSLGLLTTNVAEGSNLYYTPARVNTYIDASTTIPKVYSTNVFTGANTFNQTITGSITGNAGTAATLQTSRNINGVAFNGSADITINAATSTLLANDNTFSGNNTFSSTITGSVSGNAGTVTNGVYTTTFNGLFDTRLSATTTLPNLAVLKGLTDLIATRATTTQATTTSLAITGVTGTLLKTAANGSVIPAVAGTDYQAAGSYLTSAVTSLAQSSGSAQTGAVTFATSSDTNLLLNVTNTGGTFTFAPVWTGSLAAGRGGTGITNPSAAGILLGSYAGGSWQQLATSSLGLLTTNVAEGSNLYYTQARFDTALSSTTTLPNLAILKGLSDTIATRATTTQATSTNLFATTGVFTNLTATNAISGSVTGNANTATTLQTPRNINGVAFNGSADITINAATSTLLANDNTFSGNNTFSSTITGSVSGNAGTVTNGVYTTSFNGLFDTRLSATTTLPNLTTLKGLADLIATRATTTSATTTNLAISSITSKLLKTDANGVVTAATAGVDYQAAGSYLTNAITALGPTGQTQTGATVTLASSTSGTDFSITGSTNTITFNLPTASGSNRGLLSSNDWTTFNNKQATISAAWPITLTGATVSFNGLSTSTAATVGNIPYFSGVNTFANVATSTISVGNGVSVTSGSLGYQIGGSNVALGLSSIAANSVLANVSGSSAVPTALATSSLYIWAGTGNIVRDTSPTIITPTIAKLANLTSNGFVKTSGGDGTLSIDTSTYLTSAVTSLAQSSGSAQTGAVTFATSTGSFNGHTIGLNITNAGGTFTFTPTLTGTLTAGGGGTGITNPTAAGILLGSYAGGSWQQLATSSLAINFSNMVGTVADNQLASTFLKTIGSGTNGQLSYWTGSNTLTGVSTSTVSVGNGISVTSGSLGYQVGGSNVALGLSSIATGNVLANISGSSAVPTATATSSLYTFTGTGKVVNDTSPTFTTATEVTPVLQSAAGTEYGRIVAGGFLGAGTTTPQWQLQLASSTRAQLALSDGSLTSNHWVLRNAGGIFYLATSSPATFATSTNAAFSLNANGIPTFAALNTAGFVKANSSGTFSIDTTAYLSSAVTSLQQSSGSAQTGAVTFATSSDTNLLLNVTNSAGTFTFAPAWTGSLAAGRGGTSITNPSAAGILLGSYAGGSWQQLATSSLGLLTTNVAEGSNLYWTQTRFDTALSATTTLPALTTLKGLTDIITTRATTTNATSTSFFATTASSTNLFSSNATLANLTVTSCTGCGGAGSSPGGSGTELQFRNGSSFGAVTSSAFTSSLGTLGLGTTTPRFLLQLATSTAPQLALSDGSLTSSHWTFRNTGGYLYISSSSPSTFATTTLAALTVTSNGYLGIGTTSPVSALAVNGNISTYGAAPSISMQANDFGAQSSRAFFNLLGSSEFDIGVTDPVTGLDTNGVYFNVGGENEYISGTVPSNDTTKAHAFYVNGSPIAAIDTEGRLGLGSPVYTDTLTATFEIEGTPYGSNDFMKFLNTGGSSMLNVTATGDMNIAGAFQAASITGLLTYGSSTLQKFTFTNATGTSATTTSFFATTASSTNLFSTSATIGALTVTSCTGCGSGSGIANLGPTGQTQSGSTVTIATSTSSFNGLTVSDTVVGAGNTLTWTPALAGLLTVGGGGTGISNPTAAGVLLGTYAGGGWQQLATSSLYTFTGTGNTVRDTSPTITTPTFNSYIYTPTVYGGSAAGSTLTLVSTSGSGSGDAIIFQTGIVGSTENMRITQSGIGMGTTTPKWKLDIADSLKPQLALSDGIAVDDHWTFRNAGENLYISTSSPATFATSSTPSLTIMAGGASGLIGIGTSTPMAKLAVEMGVTDAFVVSNQGSTTPSLIVKSVNGNGNVGIGTWSPAARFVVQSTSATDQVMDVINFAGTSMFHITSAGLVGIGTTTPAFPLMVASSTKAQVVLTDASLTSNQWAFRNAGGNFYLATSSASTFATSTNTVLSIIPGGLSGSIGIGTTTPQWPVQISANTKPQLVLSDNAAVTNNHWTFRNSGGILYLATSSPATFATSTNYALAITTGGLGGTATFNGNFLLPNIAATSTIGTAVCWGNASGATGNIVKGTGTTACSASSQRFKHDITDLTDASGLGEVMALRPVSFKYNADYLGNFVDDPNMNGTFVGFIAEEVGALDRRLISVDENGIPNNVQYPNITAILVKAAQQQQHEIEDLTSSTTLRALGLETRIAAVENVTRSLEATTTASSTSIALHSGFSVDGWAVFHGGLIVNAIGSEDVNIDILGDMTFYGRPYFTKDTAGTAVVRKGAKKVDVVFERDYVETPIVSTTMALEEASTSDALVEELFSAGIQSIVVHKSVHGFTILLNKAAPEDISFSWIALPTKGAELFTSRPEDILPTTTPAPQVSAPDTSSGTSSSTSASSTDATATPPAATSTPIGGGTQPPTGGATSTTTGAVTLPVDGQGTSTPPSDMTATTSP